MTEIKEGQPPLRSDQPVSSIISAGGEKSKLFLQAGLERLSYLWRSN